MNHPHQERNAARNPNMCAAYGCPNCGSVSNSTLGTNEWLCWYHFGKDAVHWQAITAELNRLAWVVEIVTDLRANYLPDTEQWRIAYLTALKTIRTHQRSDLEKQQGESVREWFKRLERVLGEAVHAVIKMPTRQVRMPSEQHDTWTRVSMSVPEEATA